MFVNTCRGGGGGRKQPQHNPARGSELLRGCGKGGPEQEGRGALALTMWSVKTRIFPAASRCLRVASKAQTDVSVLVTERCACREGNEQREERV